MKKLYLIKVIFFTFLPFASLSAQESSPLLTGKVEISIKEGTFDCDLTLSHIPELKDYFIRINSGMNMLHMKSKNPNNFLLRFHKSRADSLSSPESTAYFFKNDTAKFLPKVIQFKYVGKFPVVTDTVENYSQKDWKGNIAFNQNSVRSDGRQSAWYPVLYDIENDKILHELRYDITISCKDCSTLYINGNAPVKAQTHNFKSKTSQELTLFCGNYDYSNVDNTFILNADLNEDEIQDFSQLVNSYKNFYSKKLQIPFEQPISFVQTTPTSKKDAWMFVSYPTIMNIGWKTGLKNMVDVKNQNWFRPFIAHELGHFYFGTYKTFNSELGDMMSEGFSEYLSLKLTEDIIGKATYQENISKKIKNLENYSAKPFVAINSSEDYNRQLYVYNYAPIIFLAIEKEIGKKQMWEWLKTILETPTKFTDYHFLKYTLQITLNDDKKFNLLKIKYLESEKSLENAIKRISSRTI